MTPNTGKPKLDKSTTSLSTDSMEENNMSVKGSSFLPSDTLENNSKVDNDKKDTNGKLETDEHKKIPDMSQGDNNETLDLDEDSHVLDCPVCEEMFSEMRALTNHYSTAHTVITEDNDKTLENEKTLKKIDQNGVKTEKTTDSISKNTERIYYDESEPIIIKSGDNKVNSISDVLNLQSIKMEEMTKTALSVKTDINGKSNKSLIEPSEGNTPKTYEIPTEDPAPTPAKTTPKGSRMLKNLGSGLDGKAWACSDNHGQHPLVRTTKINNEGEYLESWDNTTAINNEGEYLENWDNTTAINNKEIEDKTLTSPMENAAMKRWLLLFSRHYSHIFLPLIFVNNYLLTYFNVARFQLSWKVLSLR